VATRLYLLNQATPFTPSAWQGSWDLDGLTTLALDPVKFGAGSATATRSEASATSPFRVGVLRAVGRRLAPQTISGTVDVIIGVSESNLDADFFWRLHLYVINSTDNVVHGTLLSGYEESSGGGGTEWPTTNTGRALQAAQAISSVVIPSDGKDYRIVAEIGYISHNAHTTSRTGTVRLGARTTTEVDLADLTVGSTSTSTLAGFIEFSGTVSNAADVIQNLTPQLATVVTAPSLTTQNLRDGGFVYKGWYKYIPVVGDTAIGGWGFGDLAIYQPTTQIRRGEPPLAVSALIAALNVPFQVGVVLGEPFYMAAVTNSTTANPAVYVLDLIKAPTITQGPGSILINDDTDGFPLVIFANNGSVQRIVYPFPAGEAADLLRPDGPSLWADSGASNDLKLFDLSLGLITTIAFDVGFAPSIRAQQTLQRFYAGRATSPAQVKSFSPTGVELTANTLTGNNGLTGLAANNAGTILYHTRGGPNNPIKRWDLIGNVDLSDLVAADSARVGGFDILVLLDDTIVVSYTNFTTGEFRLRQFDPSGTPLEDHQIAATSSLPAGTLPRLAYADGDPASIWVMFHLLSPSLGQTRIQEIRLSDSAVLSSRDLVQFEGGVYQPAPTATPLARFGNSFSCPFIVYAAGAACPGTLGPPRIDGLPYTPPPAAFCGGGSGTLGPPRIGV